MCDHGIHYGDGSWYTSAIDAWLRWTSLSLGLAGMSHESTGQTVEILDHDESVVRFLLTRHYREVSTGPDVYVIARRNGPDGPAARFHAPMVSARSLRVQWIKSGRPT